MQSFAHRGCANFFGKDAAVCRFFAIFAVCWKKTFKTTIAMLKTKPDLSFSKLWNISFGFFGVQIAYALQSANISRIFATLVPTRTT